MKISQVRIAPDIIEFGKSLKAKYQLADYHDKYSPAFFYGCYRKEDRDAILQHKSIAVLIWGGSDAMHTSHMQILKNTYRPEDSKIFHIAPSSFIAEDLRRFNLKYYRFNIYPKEEKNFNPCPLGQKVYFYSSHRRDDRRKFYGIDYIQSLQRALPTVEFVEGYSSPRTHSFESMPDIYKECAVGVRLVPHDAGSCTVVELALMGRRTIWNGNFPGAIKYRNLQDVVRGIEQELSRVGTIDTTLPVYAKASISDEKWLSLSTYTDSLSIAGMRL